MNVKVTHWDGIPLEGAHDDCNQPARDELSAQEQINLAWLADEYPHREFTETGLQMSRLLLIRWLYRRGVINEGRHP